MENIFLNVSVGVVVCAISISWSCGLGFKPYWGQPFMGMEVDRYHINLPLWCLKITEYLRCHDRIQSSAKFILNISLLSTVWKDKNTEKEAGNGPFLKKIWGTNIAKTIKAQKKGRIWNCYFQDWIICRLTFVG